VSGGTKGRTVRRIEPYRLWIGNAGDGRAFQGLFELGIVAVVQLAVEEPPIPLPRELASLRVPLHDGGGNSAPLVRLAVSATADLIRAGIPTLVCCGAGVSRSPGVVAAALSLCEGRDPAECLRRVTSSGPADVSPAFWEEIRLTSEQLNR
jgi:protein-tyrosine phosphatase